MMALAMARSAGVVAVVTAAVAAMPAQAATTFTIDSATSGISVLSNPTACVFGSCKVGATLATLPTSFSLEVGESYTFRFADYVIDKGFGLGSASLTASLGFLDPAGSATTNGSASYFRAGGIFTPGVFGGSLNWDMPSQSITAANGSAYTVSFQNLAGVAFGSHGGINATVTLDSVAAVPEPATWALMILGFGAVAGAMRRRSAQRATVRFA